MGVPSVLINDTNGSTVWGSGIGQLVDGFFKLNLQPYLQIIETSIKCHLLDKKDFYKTEIKFDFDSLLRPDRATRIQTNSVAINSGQMSLNESRAKEGLPPKPNGDDIYLNGTLVPAGTITTFIKSEASQNEEI